MSGGDKPYLDQVVIKKVYNPEYGDDRTCKCGHKYYRHFDTYEEMLNVGCKYCPCHEFVEMTPEMDAEIYQRVVESYENAIENGHDLDQMHIMDIAFDMTECDADLEDYEPNVIRKYIERYRENKAGVA